MFLLLTLKGIPNTFMESRSRTPSEPAAGTERTWLSDAVLIMNP